MEIPSDSWDEHKVMYKMLAESRDENMENILENNFSLILEVFLQLYILLLGSFRASARTFGECCEWAPSVVHDKKR